MEFQKYNSLEQANKQKTINAAVDAGHASIMYGVTEKIHGANFGIHWTTESGTRFSRRSGFLEEGESFYSHTKIESALLERFNRLLKIAVDAGHTSVSVYGEIFGGVMNGVSAQGSKRVQKEVQYSPETQFAAFDVVLDGDYLPQVSAYNLLGFVGFHMAPLIGVYNTLEEALAVPNDMQSRVPGILGYEVEGDNVMEGVVIRPWNQDIYLPNGKHFVLKNKNAKFKEKGNEPAKVQDPMGYTDGYIFEEMSLYITENRFNAVISKEKELTQKDFGRILGLFMQDAISDYDEDGDLNVKDVVDDWKRVNKELQKLATVIVRNYWTTEL
jgi:Rnl2 family RNA ligase